MSGNASDQEVLKRIGIDNFVIDTEPRLRGLLDWLGV